MAALARTGAGGWGGAARALPHLPPLQLRLEGCGRAAVGGLQLTSPAPPAVQRVDASTKPQWGWPPPRSEAASAAQRAPDRAPRLACRSVGVTDRATCNAEGPVLNHPATAVVADALLRRQHSRRRQGGGRGGSGGRRGTPQAQPSRRVRAGRTTLTSPPPNLERRTTLPFPAPPGCRSWCARLSSLPDAVCVQLLQRSPLCFNLRHSLFFHRRTRTLPPPLPRGRPSVQTSPHPAHCARHTRYACKSAVLVVDPARAEAPPRRNWWLGRAWTVSGACQRGLACHGRGSSVS